MLENSRKSERLEAERKPCKQGLPALPSVVVVSRVVGDGGGRGLVSVHRECLPRAEPPPAPRAATTILPRATLNSAGTSADYLKMDDVNVAPLRARVRLCATRLAEHQELRHLPTTSLLCRLCHTEYESASHVLLTAMN